MVQGNKKFVEDFRNRFIDDGEYEKETQEYLEPVRKRRPIPPAPYREPGWPSKLRTEPLLNAIFRNLKTEPKVVAPAKKVRFPRIHKFLQTLKTKIVGAYNNVRDRLAKARKSYKSNTAKPARTGSTQQPMGGDKPSVYNADGSGNNTNQS